jgi:hypothetical protein
VWRRRVRGIRGREKMERIRVVNMKNTGSIGSHFSVEDLWNNVDVGNIVVFREAVIKVK